MLKFMRGKSRSEIRLMYICFYIFVCNGALTLMQGSILPGLKASYGLSDTLSGLFLSEQSAGNLIAGFLGGVLPIWLGQKKSIALLCVLALVGYIMIIAWGNPAWLFIAFLFIGVSRGGGTNFTNRHVNRLSDGSPSASNMLHACYAAGAIASPLVFLLLMNISSWRAAAGFVIVLLLIRQLTMPLVEIENDRPAKGEKSARDMSFMKQPAFLVLIAMMFCYLCTEYAVCGWLVTFIQSKKTLTGGLEAAGMSVESYSQLAAMLLWAVILIGRLICAAFATKQNRKGIMFISSLGCAAAYACMLMSGTVFTVSLSVAALGFCLAGISPMIYSDAALFTNKYPLATGALLSFGSVGGIAMPAVVGAVADRAGIAGGMTAISVTAVLLVVFAGLNLLAARQKTAHVDNTCG